MTERHEQVLGYSEYSLRDPEALKGYGVFEQLPYSPFSKINLIACQDGWLKGLASS